MRGKEFVDETIVWRNILSQIPSSPQPTIFEDEEILKIEDLSFSHYDEETKNLVFEPCVYKQRYQKIFEILINVRWRKEVETITEYGCGDYKLLQLFKYFMSLRKINFVDIDANFLKEKFGYLMNCDYQYWNRRFNPLRVEVFEGSISDPDARVLHSDVVIGVEIIEHLFPDTLEAVPYVIFHVIKPKIVIFTTPNADFNVAFPNFENVRHPDHKFEWTREQFESWATNIILRFPDYKVQFFGIGKHPYETHKLGHCSQLVLFVRKDIIECGNQLTPLKCLSRVKNRNEESTECSPIQPFGICTYLSKSKKFEETKDNDLEFYREIHSIDYLYQDDDDHTEEEKLLEIMMTNMSYQSPVTKGGCFIPLHKIIGTYSYGTLISEEEAETILSRLGFLVRKRFMDDIFTFSPSESKWKRCVWFQGETTK